MKKSLFIMILMMLVVAGCSEGSSGSGKDDVVKIGSLHPLSGGLANEGQEMRDAVRLAVEEVNENGGIKSLDGKEVELIEADHEGVPEKGVSETQRLDRDGVAGIIGAYSSGVALPATQEAEKARLPFIIDIASVDEVTERNFKYTFRLQPPASQMANNFLKYGQFINTKMDNSIKNIVLVHEDSVFGTSIAEIIEKKAEKEGFKVLATLPHSASTADLSSSINKIKSLKPDAIIATTYLRDGTLLVNGLKEAKFVPKAIIGVANGAFSNAQFITGDKSISENILDVNYTINPQSELAEDVKKRYKEKFNKELGPNGAYSYMAAKVLIDAIERAGSTDRADIQKALTETKLKEHILPQGIIEFDESGQNKNAQAVLNQITDGQTNVVYPEDYKSKEFVNPSK